MQTVSAPRYAWQSVHLKTEGDIYGPRGDELLSRLVAPLTSKLIESSWIRRFFYIRLAETGPEIRLRLHCRVREASDIRELTESAVIQWNQQGQKLISAIQWAPYRPEFKRYGGPSGVLLAERTFHSSSVCALGLLSRRANELKFDLFTESLHVTLVQLFALTSGGKEPAAIARRCCQYYLATAPAAPLWIQKGWLKTDETERALGKRGFDREITDYWRNLEADGPLPDPLSKYRQRLLNLCQVLRGLVRRGRLIREGRAVTSSTEAAEMLVPSYIHLMNNRLGVPVFKEFCVLSMIQRALR